MADRPSVLTHADGDVWRITLDRPETGNALTPALAAELGAAFEARPEQARVVLLLAMVNNALNLTDVPPLWVDAVRGLIILVALVIDAQKSRYKRRTQAKPAPK